MDKILLNKWFVAGFCTLLGCWLFMAATVTAVGIGESEYRGTDFLFILYFGFVPLAHIWLSLLVYPVYAMLIIGKLYRVAFFCLIAQHTAWMSCLLKPVLFSSKSFNPAITENFISQLQQVSFYLLGLVPFILLNLFIFYCVANGRRQIHG
jgi:hypothetical protein